MGFVGQSRHGDGIAPDILKIGGRRSMRRTGGTAVKRLVLVLVAAPSVALALAVGGCGPMR